MWYNSKLYIGKKIPVNSAYCLMNVYLVLHLSIRPWSLWLLDVKKKLRRLTYEEKNPLFSLCSLLPLFHAFIFFCTANPTNPPCLTISPLCVSIPFAFLPSQSCFFQPCVPGGPLLKERWNWMLPSQRFSFETCRRFCFAGVSVYSSLAHRHPKHQLSVMVSYGSWRAFQKTNTPDHCPHTFVIINQSNFICIAHIHKSQFVS